MCKTTQNWSLATSSGFTRWKGYDHGIQKLRRKICNVWLQ